MWTWLIYLWYIFIDNNWNQESEKMLVVWLTGDMILLAVGSVIVLGIIATMVYVLR